MQQLPEQCLRLLKRQRGVIVIWQASAAGLSPRRIENLVRYQRWERLSHGVYASFTGSPPREALLWAAVLRTGPLSVLSHETAAGLYGIIPDPGRAIHVTVPHERHLQPVPGIIIHRSSRFAQIADRASSPPHVRVDETVLDLAEAARSFDDVVALLARSCQRHVTTPWLLSTALGQRPRMRWRKEIVMALRDVADGVNSVLEYRYLHNVERPHGLPAGERQAPGSQNGRSVFRDVRYRAYRVVAELDGKASHPDEQRWQDRRRDNAAAADGDVTLRYGWADVTERACRTAAEVGAVLRRRGWPGPVRPCSPDCPTALS